MGLKIRLVIKATAIIPQILSQELITRLYFGQLAHSVDAEIWSAIVKMRKINNKKVKQL